MTSNIFIDTNIILDLVLSRKDLFESSKLAIQLARSNYKIFTSVKNILDAHYFVCKEYHDYLKARLMVKNLLKLFNIANSSAKDLILATHSDMVDLDDALNSQIAKSIHAKYIITRNTKHYKNSPVEAVSPDEFIELMNNLEK